MQILSSASAGGGEEAALDIEAVQAQLRGALLKLQYADAYLRKLPAGCSFEVVAYTSAERGGVGAVPLAEWAEEQAGSGHLELRQVGWDWAGWLAGWGFDVWLSQQARGACTATLAKLSMLRLPCNFVCYCLHCPQAEIVPIKSCTLEGAFQLQLYCEA